MERQIHLLQIDNFSWKIVVKRGFYGEWVAKVDDGIIQIWKGKNAIHGAVGRAILTSGSESAVIADAMGLVYNWAQITTEKTEELDERWELMTDIHKRYVRATRAS